MTPIRRTIRNIIILCTVAPVFDICVRFTTMRRDISLSWDLTRFLISPGGSFTDQIIYEIWWCLYIPSHCSYSFIIVFMFCTPFIFLYCYNRNRVVQELPKNIIIVIMIIIIIIFLIMYIVQWPNIATAVVRAARCLCQFINQRRRLSEKKIHFYVYIYIRAVGRNNILTNI